MKIITTLTYQQHLHLPSIITTFLVLSLLISNINALEISSLNEFINFTNAVNGGTNNFTGETVYLTTDLDMSTYSSSFVPVGNTHVSTKTFRGTFDGQGHVISNLVASGKFRYLGIFGYSYGATIKNLIVDSSCSFENKYSNDEICVTGGIIGQCYSANGECIVDNCVNKAQITYSGTKVNSIYVGGIVGKFTPHNCNASIINCVNYGNVSSVCSSLSRVTMGGIIGEMWIGSSITSSNTIKNCVNFGSLYQSGEIKNNLFIGGICGIDKPNIVYEDCVDFGGMSYNTSTTYASIGSISGQSNNGTLRDCFWDEELELNATGSSSSNVKSERNVESFKTSPLTNSDVIDILTNAKTIINFAVINFDSRGGSAVSPMLVLLTSTNKVVTSLPTPEKVESVFGGWYSDEGLGTVFDTSTLQPGNTTAYAKWIVNHYTITFTVDGAKYNESSQPYGSNIEYPPSNPTKEDFTFSGWNKTFTTVPARNIVIESLWIVNIYTITFTVDGTKYNESSQPYGSNIEYPLSNPTKEGFTFDGWYKTFTTVPAHNIVIESLWIINYYTVNFTVDEVVYNESSQSFGSAIEYPPSNPTKEGHTFNEWNKTFTTVPAHSIIIESLWTINHYTITFTVDGKKYNESSQPYGSNIEYPPSNPTKEGHTFDGWNKTFTTVPAHNIVIESLWTKNSYTITFTVDGVAYNESSQPYGSPIEYPPSNPTKEGFTFDGWYKTFTTVPAHNIVIESLWIINYYTVNFTVDGVAYNESSQPYGSAIEYPPSNPTKEGHTFNGWNKTFTTVPAHNIIIESLWIKNYTVNFTVDGVVYNESSQPYGSTIEYPPKDPTKEGFTFDGWYTDSFFVNKAESNLTVIGNITLHGRFISTAIKIEFSTKDLSKEEVIKEIEKITSCTNCFIISEFKSDGDTTIIIVKFDNADEAKYFYKTIQK